MLSLVTVVDAHDEDAGERCVYQQHVRTNDVESTTLARWQQRRLNTPPMRRRRRLTFYQLLQLLIEHE